MKLKMIVFNYQVPPSEESGTQPLKKTYIKTQKP
jgi:hypothetical protein